MTASELCGAGFRDEALISIIAASPFSSPLDADLLAVAERRAEECVLALDENLLWCRIARPQAERIVRLLKSGELAVHIRTFQPNSPDVLKGRRARFLPADTACLSGLEPARRQPSEGFNSPHRLRATLILGPNADVPKMLRVAANLRAPKPAASTAPARFKRK